MRKTCKYSVHNRGNWKCERYFKTSSLLVFTENIVFNKIRYNFTPLQIGKTLNLPKIIIF